MVTSLDKPEKSGFAGCKAGGNDDGNPGGAARCCSGGKIEAERGALERTMSASARTRVAGMARATPLVGNTCAHDALRCGEGTAAFRIIRCRRNSGMPARSGGCMRISTFPLTRVEALE
jgi:hypothetical protein